MRRRRVTLAFLSPAVAALFALAVAAPRVGFFHHRHAAGERAHVHADDDSALGELLHTLGHEHRHPHGHAHTASPHTPDNARRARVLAEAHGLALSHDNGAAPGHWHPKQQFQRAVIATVPLLAVSASHDAPADAPPCTALHVAVRDLHVRGPPPAVLS